MVELIILVIGMTTATAVAFLLGGAVYKTGLSDGTKLAKDEPLSDRRRPKHKPFKPPKTKEDILQENIENYNGTGEGQIEL